MLTVGFLAGLLLTGNVFSTDEVIDANSNVDNSNSGLSLEFVSVSTDDDAVLGSNDAPVTIVEFSDYECPYCEAFWSRTLPQLKTNYIDTGLVKLVYRDYPIDKHPESRLAAESAECVGNENDYLYYQMQDKLFGNVQEWAYQPGARDIIIGFAKDLGVDIETCLGSGEVSSEVGDDFAAAVSYGVEGTPTFFINGWKVVGAQPYEVFSAIIENELK